MTDSGHWTAAVIAFADGHLFDDHRRVLGGHFIWCLTSNLRDFLLIYRPPLALVLRCCCRWPILVGQCLQFSLAQMHPIIDVKYKTWWSSMSTGHCVADDGLEQLQMCCLKTAAAAAIHISSGHIAYSAHSFISISGYTRV
jgi:hypothetical protein